MKVEIRGKTLSIPLIVQRTVANFDPNKIIPLLLISLQKWKSYFFIEEIGELQNL